MKSPQKPASISKKVIAKKYSFFTLIDIQVYKK
jgi:hypothetical protein